MTFVNLCVAALATWQAVEIWHHSSIMAGWRARVELFDNFVSRLVGCPYCLSVWVGLLMGALAWSTDISFATPVTGLFAHVIAGCIAMAKLAMYALAVSRLANLGNDLAHKYTRTPKTSSLPEQDGVDFKAQIKAQIEAAKRDEELKNTF